MKILLPFVKELCSPNKIILDIDIQDTFAMYTPLKSGNIYNWEREVLASLLALSSITDKPRFLDIGANIGFYSLALSALFGDHINITAVEPNPHLVKKFEELAKNNNLHIKIIKKAISIQCDNAKFYISNDDSCSSLNICSHGIQKIIDVETSSLNDIYDGWNIIKIDTEGTEHDVLTSGLESIITNKPTIAIEVLNKGNSYKIKELVDKIKYNIYLLKKDFTIVKMDDFIDPQKRGEYNYILTPKELSQEFYDAQKAWQEAITLTSNFVNKSFSDEKNLYFLMYSYIKYKFNDYVDFIFFPINNYRWSALYHRSLSKEIHYEFNVQNKLMFICFHAETKDKEFNSHLCNIIFTKYKKRELKIPYTLEYQKSNSMHGLRFSLPFYNSYEYFDLYIASMKNFIKETIDIILTNKCI